MNRRFRFSRIIWLASIILVALTAWSVPATTWSQQSRADLEESEQIENYLRSLNLDQLVIEHVEDVVANEPDQNKRLELARRLITLYSQQLMSGLPSGTKYRQKANWFLRTYPQLSTPAIRMAILQAKYTDLEKQFLEWWYQGASATNKTSLIDGLRDLKDELETIGRKLEEEYQDRLALMQSSSENRAAESRMILQVENLVLHGHYLSGWAEYFRGVLSSGERTDHFRSAGQHFRKFLQIEAQKVLNDVSSKWFDFTSDWSIRALVGLAMCESGLNHPDQATYCLDLIEEHATQVRTRDMRAIWELNSHLYVNDFSKLETLTGDERARALSDTGSVMFWNELLKASIAIRNSSLVKSKLLMRRGLSGLARSFQADRINEFLETNRISIEPNEAWEWFVSGYLDFVELESSNNKAGLLSARKKLTQSLELASAESNQFNIQCARYLIARIDLIQKDYESAAVAFQGVSDAVIGTNQELASEAQWLAIVALSKLAEKEPRNAFKAIRMIDQAIIRFPGSKIARRAKFERLKLANFRLPREKAIENLSRIPATDESYPLALNEIVKARYQLLLEAMKSEDTTARQRRTKELQNAELQYRQLSNVSVASKLKSSLLIVDAVLRDSGLSKDSEQFDLINEQLGVAEKLAKQAPGSQEGIEFQFYKFQVAVRTGITKEVESQATWLIKNAKGTNFEVSALIQLARLADQDVRSQTTPDAPTLSRAISRFEQLLELLGTSDESLKNFANSRVAYLRLAELKLQAGQNQQSLQMSQNLVQLFPNHVTFLRQLAKVQTTLKDFENAMEVWRKLAKGVEPGSDTWFESKLNLALCHFENGDLERANQLVNQTLRLGGVIPDRWQVKFDDFLARVSRFENKDE